MDSRQQRPQRKTLQWQLAQEQGHESLPHRPSATSSQPDTKNNLQEDLQTQDWVSSRRLFQKPRLLDKLIRKGHGDLWDKRGLNGTERNMQFQFPGLSFSNHSG